MLAGDVRVGTRGSAAEKPGQMVADDVTVEVAEGPRFVSRGGQKLENALDAFGLRSRRAAVPRRRRVHGRVHRLPAPARRAATWSRSTSPTASSHWRLRNDPRVTVIERRNARELEPDELPYRPDLVVADLSFISLDEGAAAPDRGRRRVAGTASRW